MNSTNENQRLALMAQLRVAETALRGNLHVHGAEAVARAHMERALAHVHEAFSAVSETGRARTVQQLVEEVERLEKLLTELRQQPPPGVTVKSNRV
jgi:hypothetical protein